MVNVTKIGAITDLKVGDAVVVRGTTDAEGTVAATAISSGNGQGGARGTRGGNSSGSGTQGAGATQAGAANGGTTAGGQAGGSPPGG